MSVLEVVSQTGQRQTSSGSYGLSGTVVAGSYSPEDGTVEIVVGEALSNFEDSDYGDQQPYKIVGSLMTPMVGFQAGPQGGERALLMPMRGGYRVILIHGNDDLGSDGPGTPVGELWYLHAKAGTVGAGNKPVFDGGVKFTNDGPTTGDGLGGSHLGEDGAHSTLDTQTGHQVELNDTSKQIVVKTAGVGNPNPLTTTYDDPSQTIKHAIGTMIFSVIDAINSKITHQAGSAVSTTLIDTNTVQQIIHEAGTNVETVIDGVLSKITHTASPNVQTIVDGAGNAISHVIPTGGSVNLGAVPGVGSGLVPAISKTDMTKMISDTSTGINIQRWVDLVFTTKALLVTMAATGVPSLPGLSEVIAEMTTIFGTNVPGFNQLPGWSAIAVPSGSAHVNLIP
jgi:hypothetical protein